MTGPHELNPAWILVIVSLVGTIVQAVVSIMTIKGSMGRYEERQLAHGNTLSRLERCSDEHNEQIGDHTARIRVLENEIDLRPPPLDFPRRA